MKKIIFILVFLFITSLSFNSYAFSIPVIGYTGDSEKGEVTINDNVVITIKTSAGGNEPLERAKIIARQLNVALFARELRADRVTVGLVKGEYVGRVGKRIIFTVDKKSAELEKVSQPVLALKWVTNIQDGLGGVPYMDDVNRSKTVINTSYLSKSYIGLASWYGGHFNGRYTASGEQYNIKQLTAAHKFLPFGTIVLVTNVETSKSVVVRITDRGPFVGARIIDLSPAAFKKIGSLNSGVLRVRLDVLN